VLVVPIGRPESVMLAENQRLLCSSEDSWIGKVSCLYYIKLGRAAVLRDKASSPGKWNGMNSDQFMPQRESSGCHLRTNDIVNALCELEQ
jgi:hypothetical protein